MNHIHNLLKRQIAKLFGGSFSIPEEWNPFILAVNEAYLQFDTDRHMLERSLDLSSQELLQANSEMRALIRAFPDLLFRIDRDGKILEYKSGSRADLFHEDASPVGKHIQDVPSKNLSRKFRDAIQTVKDTNSMIRIEYSLTMRGQELFYEARLLPLLENQIMVIIRNITEQKMAEQALKESEEKFRAIMTTANDAIILMDQDGNISYWNPAAERIFGYRSQEVTGRELHTLLAPQEFHDSYRQGFALFRNSGRGPAIEKTIEFIAIRKDGSRFPIEVSTAGLLVKGTWHAVGIIRDITERKKTEQALKEGEEKYRTLLENINIGVYRATMDSEGTLIQANPAMARIFGYDSLEEFMNVRLSQLYNDPEERTLFMQEIEEAGSLEDRELLLRKKDGTLIWTSVTVNMHQDHPGGMKYIDGVLEDITERKKIEEHLRQVQKMDAIGTLAGGIAHDFNNILTAIFGYANLLKENILQDTHIRTFADQILTSAEKASLLTQSLLAFSRKQIISPRAVNLNHIVRNLEMLLRRVIGEDITLNAELSGEELVVMADQGQMEQLLMNLAANARDAMPDGGILTIKTGRVFLDNEFAKTYGFGIPGSYAQLIVQDTGTGMHDHIRERIFEPFFTTKEVGKGTGLGLAIAYGIVKQHEGYINVYSEPGKGSVFKIYLPLRKIAREEAEVPGPQVYTTGGTETILLCEDDFDVRKITRDLLAGAGYTVIEAVDGKDALRVFNDHRDRIDLLVFDVIMPRMSGKEAYEEIRKIQPSVKVLFTSGYTGDILQRRGIMEEGLHFLSKPVSPDMLLKKVREILGG
jgi:PAS domain S-box-containing protein